MIENEPEGSETRCLEMRDRASTDQGSGNESSQERSSGVQVCLQEAQDREIVLQKRIRELEARVVAMERMARLGMGLSGVAHEINNLMTGALGFTHLLGRSPANAELKEQKMLSSISGELNRCVALTRKLANYARHDRLAHEIFDLNSLLEAEVETLRRPFLEQSVRIELELPPGPSPMSGVSFLVREAIKQLLNTSREGVILEGPGWIRATLTRESGALMLCIADSSGGGPPSERTFEPVYAAPEMAGGDGLALTIVKGIVKDHGGKLHVVQEDEGAVYTVRFSEAQQLKDTTTRL